ncbi:MAG: ABC transporter permease [Haloarculaceae archaeon]
MSDVPEDDAPDDSPDNAPDDNPVAESAGSDAADAERSAAAELDEALREQFTWYAVAKKEFKDTVRSRGLWVLSAVFTVFFLLPAAGVLYGFIDLRQYQSLGMEVLISGLYLDLVTFLLPLVAIYVGFAAISDERTRGSLKLLLSLPFSRRDVVVGKVVGRCAVVGVTLAVAFTLTAVFLVMSRIPFKGVTYGLFALYTGAFTVVMVAIAVSVSGAVRTNRQSVLANFFVYFYFTFAWNSLANSLGQILKNQVGVGGSGRWHTVLFVKLLNPSQAYKTLTNSMLGTGENAVRQARYGLFQQSPEQMATICTDLLRGNATVRQTMFGNRTVCQPQSAGVPAYFSDPAVLLYALLWIVLAATVSYYTFNRGDL